MTIQNISVNGGKYTVQFDEDSGKLSALRYGEPWRDLTGDNLVYWLAVDLEETRAKLKVYQDCEIRNSWGRELMSYGKSQAAYIWAKASYEHNKDIRIGCTSEAVYDMLVSDGIPEENLVKLWETVGNEIIDIYWDECYD